MKTKKAVVSAVSVLALVLGMVALGTPDAAAIDIDTVVIGDIGNANDPTTGYGGVNYAYAIGKYEVTLTQYTAFLNAVAVTDTYSLYNVDLGTAQNIAGIYRTGSSGSFVYSVIGSGNRPVTNVSWFDAARFAELDGKRPTRGGTGKLDDGIRSLRAKWGDDWVGIYKTGDKSQYRASSELVDPERERVV